MSAIRNWTLVQWIFRGAAWHSRPHQDRIRFRRRHAARRPLGKMLLVLGAVETGLLGVGRATLGAARQNHGCGQEELPLDTERITTPQGPPPGSTPSQGSGS